MSADQDSGAVLPVRTSRYRRTGRHRSAHQLSLPSDSPALVIAVPGSARPESIEVAERIADMAAASCHGAEVRIGFLRGNQDHLDDVLADLVIQDDILAGVVVPLLPFPNPEVDQAVSESVAAAEAQLLIADPLGPHPLLAEALHARLADVGLARAARVGRISIVTETAADGVIVGAVGGEEAVQAAEVVAVLLASRLTTPVAAASLNDPGSIKDAAARLRQAVPRVALAPCMVGPELTAGTLEAIAALTSTDCAPPLGSHPAVGQLVAIRYGAALADPQIAAMVARGKTAFAHSATSNGGAPPASRVDAPPAGHTEVPPADPAGHAEAPPAGHTEVPPAGHTGAPPAGPAKAPPAGHTEAPPANANHAEAPPADANHAEAPPADPAGHAEAPLADLADAQPASGDGAGSQPAPAPPAGTSAQ
jgi:sirohydrochlorin ferrochelatase